MAEIKDNNELLREKYMNSLRKLKVMYDKGELALDSKSLEKIQHHLNKEKIKRIVNKELFEQDDHTSSNKTLKRN